MEILFTELLRNKKIAMDSGIEASLKLFVHFQKNISYKKSILLMFVLFFIFAKISTCIVFV